MRNSQILMTKANILPRLRLAIKDEGKAPIPTGPHRVKILEDKVQKGKDKDGNIIDVVKYILEENGEKKYYEVPVKDKQGELHYLVQRMSEVQEGQEVILEMKKRGIKNYVSVALVSSQGEVELDEDEPSDHPKIQGTDIDYPTADEEGIIHDSSPFGNSNEQSNNN